MGTRNITSVILDGKQVVCQYGQWDGYPSYTGVKLLEFLRDADLSQLKQALKNTTITVSDYEKAVSYTGSTKDYSAVSEIVYAAKCTLHDKNKEWPESETVFKYLTEQGKVSEDELENYYVWTRDTGCDILPLIYHRALTKPPLELSAMTHEYNGDYAWDIQGIYVLNLDEGTLNMTYDGYSCTFDLNALPAEIEKTMLLFEKATEVFYDCRQDDKDFLCRASALGTEKGDDGVWQLASDLSRKIGSSLIEEYPDLFSKTQLSAFTDEHVQTFLYGLLSAKAVRENQSLAGRIQLAQAKSNLSHMKDTAVQEQEPER